MVEFTKKRLINTLFWLFSMCPRRFSHVLTRIWHPFFDLRLIDLSTFTKKMATFIAHAKTPRSPQLTIWNLAMILEKLTFSWYRWQILIQKAQIEKMMSYSCSAHAHAKTPEDTSNFSKNFVRIFVLKYKHL